MKNLPNNKFLNKFKKIKAQAYFGQNNKKSTKTD